MNFTSKLIVFALGQLQCGIALEAVERVVRVVEITPLPGVLPMLLGVVNVQGQVVPVVDISQRFGFTLRPVTLSDQLLITKWNGRILALKVDTVCEVCDCPDNSHFSAESIMPNLPFIKGVVKSANGLILIQDLNQLVSAQEYGIIQELVGQK
ncbi:MAG: chemotaxis protein CheW [Desulfuromonas sp.]|nr:chemotaxis protein CheW [Desulfuromonas sp.]